MEATQPRLNKANRGRPSSGKGRPVLVGARRGAAQRSGGGMGPLGGGSSAAHTHRDLPSVLSEVWVPLVSILR